MLCHRCESRAQFLEAGRGPRLDQKLHNIVHRAVEYDEVKCQKSDRAISSSLCHQFLNLNDGIPFCSGY